MNVLLITVDCLRHDRLGITSGRTDLTPNLDRFSQGATVFTQAIAQGYNTATSFPSIFTGAYPSVQKRGWHNRPVMEGHATLAGILGSHGFATGGFHSNPWLSSHFGHGKEYDVYEDNLLPAPIRSRSRASMRLARVLRLVSPYVPADKVTAQAAGWIRQQRTPFFAWIHYMDAHGPYRVEGRLPASAGNLWSFQTMTLPFKD